MSSPIVSLTREFQISGAHHLSSKCLSAAENAAAYGDCSQIHGFSYILSVTLKGPVDVKTGMMVNIDVVKDIVKEMILDSLDHCYINTQVPFFRETPSTAENLTVFIWDQLAKGMTMKGVSPDLLSKVLITDHGSRSSILYEGERINKVDSERQEVSSVV